ncbi:hypothetical protein HDV00_010324 [Rhizophlyctis rosea]|nr:hypothetical protein HDV00_010324 [Rhizophlyctis rosea]
MPPLSKILVPRSLSTFSILRFIPSRPLSTPAATSSPPRPSSRLPGLLLAFVAGAAAPTYYFYTERNELVPFHTDDEEAAHAALLEAERDQHEIVKQLRQDKNLLETDPYSYLDGGRLHRNFTAGLLRGKGKFALRPALFHNEEQTEITAVIHVGSRMCGHDGIVHGGVLSTLMDEMLARATIPSLPNGMGFTANLNINFRKPVSSDQFLVLRSRLNKVEGRKAFAEAWIESVDGKTKFVDATGLFVSPKSILSHLVRWRPT